MTTIDIIILIALGAGVIVGFMKGFIRQLASILGLIVGLLAAKALYTSLAVKLCPTVVASVLTKALEAVSLGWLNRMLGAGLGALKYLLLVSLVICVIQFIDSDSQLISQTKKEQSLLYYPMESFAGIFFPAAKEVTQQYIFK